MSVGKGFHHVFLSLSLSLLRGNLALAVVTVLFEPKSSNYMSLSLSLLALAETKPALSRSQVRRAPCRPRGDGFAGFRIGCGSINVF